MASEVRPGFDSRTLVSLRIVSSSNGLVGPPAQPSHAAAVSKAKTTPRRGADNRFIVSPLNEHLGFPLRNKRMDQSSASQNRKSRRSNVFMKASIEQAGASREV